MRRAAVAALAALLVSAAPAPPSPHWQQLQPGVELAVIDGLYVVRIDPQQAQVKAAMASESGAPRTAGAWCQSANLSVAINLGMFQDDGRRNVGYLRHGTQPNNPRWNDYRAVLALHPKDPSQPPLVWRDLDQSSAKDDLGDYDLVVQNLRLIAGERKNVWGASEKKWSEAAIAVDAHNRLLFLFSHAPYTMRDFNSRVLALPLEITRAMHVEGGPEASLSIHAGGVNLDLFGSYETGFIENDSNHEQWAIPNVLGVAR